MNLLQETLAILSEHGRTKDDVLWCGNESFGYFTWEDFEKLANDDYNETSELREVVIDLLIVGKDFWLERHKYDNSEGWKYKTFPKKPEKYVKPYRIISDGLDTVECTLQELHDKISEREKWLKEEVLTSKERLLESYKEAFNNFEPDKQEILLKVIRLLAKQDKSDELDILFKGLRSLCRVYNRAELIKEPSLESIKEAILERLKDKPKLEVVK
jgi:hypothetical protein